MNELIVSLDGMSKDKALNTANNLKGHVWGFKISDLILHYGGDIVYSLKKYGKVFADLKLYDSPSVVRSSVKILELAGADFISCHILGGTDMLTEAIKASKKTKIIGVTTLTSMDFDEIRNIHRGYPLERFHDIVKDSQIPGVLCSSAETQFWSLFPLIKIVSGFRPFGDFNNDDQVRTCRETTAEYLILDLPTSENNPIKLIEQINNAKS